MSAVSYCTQVSESATSVRINLRWVITPSSSATTARARSTLALFASRVAADGGGDVVDGGGGALIECCHSLSDGMICWRRAFAVG